MGTLLMSDAIPAKNWDDSPVKLEANGGDTRDASSIEFEAHGGDVLPDVKEEEQLLEPVNDEPADGILDSLPIDLEAKNGDASLITEEMKKEEEQLEETRLKALEEEEARKREAAARLALDPETRYNKLDELLAQTQLYSEFLLENMDRIAEESVETQPEEPQVQEKKKGRGRKRKAKPAYNDVRADSYIVLPL